MQYLAVSLSSLGNRKRGRRRRLPERRSKIEIHAIEIIKVFQVVNDAILNWNDSEAKAENKVFRCAHVHNKLKLRNSKLFSRREMKMNVPKCKRRLLFLIKFIFL